MYENDSRIVMTLDAGGTNFVFSAMAGGREIVEPVNLSAKPNDITECLEALTKGFEAVKQQLPHAPAAISFAFPGPADYENGIIGDLPNFPAFRGGVALGPYLQRYFGIPVFINNDGNLFAYGEAMCGALPQVNRMLEEKGVSKRYKNLLGITFGTGFGAGVVVDGRLLSGDNGCGGDVWVFRNKSYPKMICEESVSIRAIRRFYGELSGCDVTNITPKDVYDIAEDRRPGDRMAAIRSFELFGEAAGDVISQANTIADGIIVIGGGLAGAAKYFMPALMKEMREDIGTFAGDSFPRIEMTPYNIDCEAEAAEFVKDGSCMVRIPQCEELVPYVTTRKTAVMISRLGASNAIALGAYAFAISKLDQ